MLTLAVIDAKAAESVITWLGVIFIALVGVMVAGVWFAVGGAVARRARHPEDHREDPNLEALRHEHLVVSNESDRQGADMVELAPDSPSPETERSKP